MRPAQKAPENIFLPIRTSADKAGASMRPAQKAPENSTRRFRFRFAVVASMRPAQKAPENPGQAFAE